MEIVAGAVERERTGGERRENALEGAVNRGARGERTEANGAALVTRTMAAMVPCSLARMLAAEAGAPCGDGAAGLAVGFEGSADADWHGSPKVPTPPGGYTYVLWFEVIAAKWFFYQENAEVAGKCLKLKLAEDEKPRAQWRSEASCDLSSLLLLYDGGGNCYANSIVSVMNELSCFGA